MFWASLAFSLALLGVGLIREWLQNKMVLDMPGRRRLHALPIARGGGLALVAAIVIVTCWVFAVQAPALYPPILAGLLVVTVVGWRDDRQGVGIVPRLAVHLAAGLVLVFAFWTAITVIDSLFWQITLAALIVLAVVASINLHNFMDGANGLLAMQSLFVLSVVFLLSWGDDSGLSRLLLIAFAAVLGFIPWNFPQARIFLGDSGSGALGYLLAALTLWAWSLGALNLVEALLIHSLVLIDALSTLVFRMLARRRWWQGHREHLYQWLVRGGRSHAQVVLSLQLWNLLLIAPLLWFIRASDAPLTEPIPFDCGLQQPKVIVLTGLVFLGGFALRVFLKYRILRAHRAK